MTNRDHIIQTTQHILDEPVPPLDAAQLRAYVEDAFATGARLLRRIAPQKPPLWVLERDVLRARADRFRTAFEAALPQTGFFYAMKSNNHPEVSRTLADAGFGIDVSSGVELGVALTTDAREIVFSGPGKTDDELDLALENAPRVTLLIDSFGELDRVSRLIQNAQSPIAVGVRITPPPPNRWRKFGVPIARLAEFLGRTSTVAGLDLRGIQFHSSWNMGPEAQVAVIRALGAEITQWPAERRAQLRFLDIGGGFWPQPGEWLLPCATPPGRILDALEIAPDASPPAAYPSQPIEAFADALAEALREHILPHADLRVCFEPGRYLCNDAMHLLLTVVDKKADDLVVTDAGTNAIGWERFESDYCPVLNLSRPALEERRCEVVGSLCTPHDYWGFSYWGAGIESGDILMIPRQGAYTWSLRQEFIKPLPGFLAV